jgi:hypothetical protein
MGWLESFAQTRDQIERRALRCCSVDRGHGRRGVAVSAALRWAGRVDARRHRSLNRSCIDCSAAELGHFEAVPSAAKSPSWVISITLATLRSDRTNSILEDRMTRRRCLRQRYTRKQTNARPAKMRMSRASTACVPGQLVAVALPWRTSGWSSKSYQSPTSTTPHTKAVTAMSAAVCWVTTRGSGRSWKRWSSSRHPSAACKLCTPAPIVSEPCLPPPPTTVCVSAIQNQLEENPPTRHNNRN